MEQRVRESAAACSAAPCWEESARALVPRAGSLLLAG